MIVDSPSKIWQKLLVDWLEEVIDQVVAQFDVEDAGVLFGVLGVGVVVDDVGAARGRVNVDLAAEAVLPAGVADERELAIGVYEEAFCDGIVCASA